MEILSAADGAEALEVIKKELPTLVFLDIMMPKVSGYSVCRTIKQDPTYQDVNIILLTAKGQEIDRKEGLASGAMKYLTKPFDPDEILALAKQILEIED